MPSFNKITIVGHLGRDPELKYTPQSTAVANFSIATTEKRKSGGETQETTTWFRVTVFGKQAEIANEYLKKGALVYVEGRLRLNEYTDRDGNKRASIEVTADNFQMLGGRDQGEPQGEREQQGRAAFAAQAPAQRGGVDFGRVPERVPPSEVPRSGMASDDDIPF